MQKGEFAMLALSGAEFAVRVKPGARRNSLERDGAGFVISVTAPPEDGKANAAVQALLAQALGVAKTRLSLIRGAGARQKLFRLD